MDVPENEDPLKYLRSLLDTLDEFDGKAVAIEPQESPPPSPAEPMVTQQVIDAVHEGLLIKRRGGSLGLGD